MANTTKTVLVADDDRTTRSVLAKILTNEGYKVELAERGEKCLFLALEKDIDAFLVDMNMPGLDGIEICQRIRAIERYKIAPIIFITAMAEESALSDVFLAGATDFISKPVIPVILIARLHAHLQKVKYFNEIEQTRRYLNRYISSKTQLMVEAYSLTGMLPMPERHKVCVMFTDLRGFTALSRETDLEILFEGLSKNLGTQVDTVYGYGGYIDKFGGDGLMAIFEGDDMVEQACRCALDIVNNTRRNQEAGDKSAFPVGIGIHIGEVLIGNIGSAEHLDYSVIGETVNLASRLCNYAEPMQVSVSGDIVTAAKSMELSFDEPKFVEMKGIAEPVAVYQLKLASKAKNRTEMNSFS